MDKVLNLLTPHLDFLFVLICLGLILVFLLLERTGLKINLRPIQAFSHLRRAIDLAVEAGKRLHISLGRGTINGLPGGSALVGLTILDRSARAASNSDRPPIATSGDAIITILSQDTLQSTYRSLSSENRFEATNARLTGLTPLSYAAGAMPAIHDDHVHANIYSGHFGSEVALLTEAGERSRSLTVAGSDSLSAQSILYATADEPLIGEELYAAGAYLGEGITHAACVRMQDVIRWVLVGVIIGGAILKIFGALP